MLFSTKVNLPQLLDFLLTSNITELKYAFYQMTDYLKIKEQEFGL